MQSWTLKSHSKPDLWNFTTRRNIDAQFYLGMMMMSYQRGERHKVLWGLWEIQLEEGVAGVRRRGEGSGLVAAEQERLSPGAHAHQGFCRLQIRVLQRGRAAAGSTGDGTLAVVSPPLHTRPIFLHVFSLRGNKTSTIGWTFQLVPPQKKKSSSAPVVEHFWAKLA